MLVSIACIDSYVATCTSVLEGTSGVISFDLLGAVVLRDCVQVTAPLSFGFCHPQSDRRMVPGGHTTKDTEKFHNPKLLVLLDATFFPLQESPRPK